MSAISEGVWTKAVVRKTSAMGMRHGCGCAVWGPSDVIREVGVA